MESPTPVNWEALDFLVIDFAKSENLIEESPSSSSSSASSSSSSLSVHSSALSLSSSSYQFRLIIRQIRRSLESGHVDSAIDLLRAHAPFILDDRRLLFLLQKQKFIELLRRGTMEDRDCAISCLRNSLAPCALDAYPEAYEEFKHVLLALIYDKDDQSSPVANEWSERSRFDIAGLLSTVLKASLHAYDPVFSMTLRYLISIHKGFCFSQGISSPILDLTERLLLEERDPRATVQETSYNAPPFDEVDIQALAHAVELTRQDAVESLRFSKGDLFQAFQNELCRMRLDVTVLDELVLEYCVYRGIVESAPANSSASEGQTLSKQLKVDQPVLGLSSDKNCSAGKSSDTCSDVTSMQGIEVELRYHPEIITAHEGCSTSGSHQPETVRVHQRSKLSAGERNKRKRWRGRADDNYQTQGNTLGEFSKQEFSTNNTSESRERQGMGRQMKLDINNKEVNYELVLGIKELADKGLAAEVVNEVNTMDPNFFEQNPIFLFQLKQVEFLKLVSIGDFSGALKVACSHLGPLASGDPALLKSLKETLLALLQPNEYALRKGLPLHALANSLQVAIGKRLGIEEPQLMKIIRATLDSHNEWFRLQMCKDSFEGLLRIDSLKEAKSTLLTSSVTTPKINTERSNSVGSPQATISSSSRMSEDSSASQASLTDGVCDETAILKVMEFLALPRADAIHLLAQYNGNAETVIQQIFA